MWLLRNDGKAQGLIARKRLHPLRTASCLESEGTRQATNAVHPGLHQPGYRHTNPRAEPSCHTALDPAIAYAPPEVSDRGSIECSGSGVLPYLVVHVIPTVMCRGCHPRCHTIRLSMLPPWSPGRANITNTAPASFVLTQANECLCQNSHLNATALTLKRTIGSGNWRRTHILGDCGGTPMRFIQVGQ